MQNPSYSLLSSSHSHELASLSDLNGRAHCLGAAPSRLSGHIGQWYHPTVSAQWLDHVAPGRVGDPRTEARPIHLFIYFIYTYLFHLFTTPSTDIVFVAINAEVIMWWNKILFEVHVMCIRCRRKTEGGGSDPISCLLSCLMSYSILCRRKIALSSL